MRAFKFFTIGAASILFWLCLIAAVFFFVQDQVIDIFIAAGLCALAAFCYLSSISIEKSIIEEDRDGDDDGDGGIGPYYQVKFS